MFKVFLETTFLHVSCEPKIYLRFFKVCTYPSIHNFGLEAPPCIAISEGWPPLSNKSSEAGALPLKVRIENDSDRKNFKSKIFKVFLETTFLHVSCEPKIYVRFFKVCTYPSIHNFGLEAPPCIAISEGWPPLSNTSLEAGALPLEIRFENDSDRNFLSRNFVHSFSGNHFSPRFMLICSL